jgi:glycine dehydrogenase subunit 1
MPHAYQTITDEEQQRVLAELGVASIDELLKQVPQRLQFRGGLNLPPATGEWELEHELKSRTSGDIGANRRICFQGGGAYDHFIPAVVDEMTSRGEFYTAYTPYQPEASQGSLQAFFEYQTLICQLTGMDVSNASLYDGGTAVSEAAFMAMRVTGRHDKIVALAGVHPEYRGVVETYVSNLPTQVVTVPLRDGVADLDALRSAVDDKTACVIIQHPNFLGHLEDVAAVAEIAHTAGALAVQVFDPISLGLLKRPADLSVDIAVAEGQSLGIPLQYGGPYLGILACREEFIRKMPGRIVCQAVDRNGKTCYVLGLQTREQHIRREKATSNICTNQGLLALRATVYLAAMGPQGMKEAATRCVQNVHYAADRLSRVRGLKLLSRKPIFKEFAVLCDDPASVMAKASQAGFDLGPALSRFGCPHLSANGLLVAVTEQRTKEEIDSLVDAIAN